MTERAVAEQLQIFLGNSYVLDPFHSGFRPGYGTEDALEVLVDDFHLNASFFLLLDASAAFTSVNHVILLRHLKAEVGIMDMP